MSEAITEKKRKRSRPAIARINIVERLPPNVRDEIDDKLLSGETPRKISDWLKVEKDVEIGIKGIQNYVEKVIVPMTAFRGTAYKKAVAGFKKKIDALEELHKLAQLQMKRVSVGMVVEETKKSMISQVDKGLDVLRSILNDILNREMDLGVRARTSVGETQKGITDEQLRDLLLQVSHISQPDEASKDEQTNPTAVS